MVTLFGAKTGSITAPFTSLPEVNFTASEDAFLSFDGSEWRGFQSSIDEGQELSYQNGGWVGVDYSEIEVLGVGINQVEHKYKHAYTSIASIGPSNLPQMTLAPFAGGVQRLSYDASDAVTPVKTGGNTVVSANRTPQFMVLGKGASYGNDVFSYGQVASTFGRQSAVLGVTPQGWKRKDALTYLGEDAQLTAMLPVAAVNIFTFRTLGFGFGERNDISRGRYSAVPFLAPAPNLDEADSFYTVEFSQDEALTESRYNLASILEY